VFVDIDDSIHSRSANPESSSARTTTTLGEIFILIFGRFFFGFKKYDCSVRYYYYYY
jgi:hypothetical protein